MSDPKNKQESVKLLKTFIRNKRFSPLQNKNQNMFTNFTFINHNNEEMRHSFFTSPHWWKWVLSPSGGVSDSFEKEVNLEKITILSISKSSLEQRKNLLLKSEESTQICEITLAHCPNNKDMSPRSISSVSKLKIFIQDYSSIIRHILNAIFFAFSIQRWSLKTWFAQPKMKSH